MGSIKYIVKPEEGVVVGIGTYSYTEMFPQFKYDSLNWDQFHLFNSLAGFYWDDTKQFRAVARCSAPDEFDMEFGKKLVAAKIQLKKNEYICKEINKMFKRYEKLEKKMMGHYKQCFEKMDFIDKDLREYFGLKE